MATVVISFEITDAEGDSLTLATHWDTADVDTVAKAQDAATDFETLIQNVMGPVVTGIQVAFPLTHETVETADSGYSVYSGATISVRNSDDQGDSIYIPGILQSNIQNEVVVVASGTAMEDFVNALTTSDGFGTGSPASRISTRGSGSLWNTYVKGKRSTRKP